MAAHREFITRHAATLRGGNRLHPSGASTSIRHTADGGVAVSDGSFAETKEVIGGYAVLAGDSREDVIRATREFMQLHLDHWPEWEGECELRELVFLAP